MGRPREDVPTPANITTSAPLASSQTPEAALCTRYRGPKPRGEPGLAPAWRLGNGGGRFRSASSDISHNRVVAACRPQRPCRNSANHSWLLTAALTLPKTLTLYTDPGASNPRKTDSLGGRWMVNTEQQTLTCRHNFCAAETKWLVGACAT